MPTDTLSEHDLAVLYDVWAVRQCAPDAWAAVEYEHVERAMRLHLQGWLDLDTNDRDLLWRFSDRGLATLTAAQYTALDEWDSN